MPRRNEQRETTYARWARPTIVAAATVAFVLKALDRYAGASTDDVFISLWTGERLAALDGLVNYNFEPLEISSSLLHTIVIAGLALLNSENTFILNKLFCLLCAASLLTFVGVYTKSLLDFGSPASNLAALVAVEVMIASFPAFLFWSMAGLETPLQTTLLFLYWAMLSSHWLGQGSRRALVLAIVVQCAYMITRPEGFLLILFSVVYVVLVRLVRPEFWRASLPLVWVPTLFGLIVAGLRYAMLGAFFPNPVYAKGSVDPIGEGLVYLGDFYMSGRLVKIATGAALLSACYFVFLIVKRRSDLRADMPAVLLLGVVLMQLCFVLCVGGDWMAGFRFLVPIIPAACLLTIWSAFRATHAIIRFVAPRMPAPVARLGFLHNAGSIAVLTAMLFLSATNAFQSLRTRLGLHGNSSLQGGIADIVANGWDLESVNRTVMRLNLGHRRDLLAAVPFIENDLAGLATKSRDGRIVFVTYQMGLVPYFVKRTRPDLDVYFVDTLGLCDRQIARMPLARGKGGVQAGDGVLKILDGSSGVLSAYILAKNPNLVYLPRNLERAEADYAALGFAMVHTRPGATYFFKSTT
jgi:hypothetical protein